MISSWFRQKRSDYEIINKSVTETINTCKTSLSQFSLHSRSKSAKVSRILWSVSVVTLQTHSTVPGYLSGYPGLIRYALRFVFFTDRSHILTISTSGMEKEQNIHVINSNPVEWLPCGVATLASNVHIPVVAKGGSIRQCFSKSQPHHTTM